MHLMAAPSTVSSRGEPYVTQSTVLHSFQQYGGTYSFGGLVQSHLIPSYHLHHGKGSSFPGLVPPSDTVSSKSKGGIKPCILVWWLGIRLMSLLTPGDCCMLLIAGIFILVSWARCHLQPTSCLNQGVRIIPFLTRQWQTLNRVWISSSLTLLRQQNWLYHLKNLSWGWMSSAIHVISGNLCISSNINSCSIVQVSGRICHKSFQTSYSSGIMLDGRSMVSHIFQHVGRHSSLGSIFTSFYVVPICDSTYWSGRAWKNHTSKFTVLPWLLQ